MKEEQTKKVNKKATKPANKKEKIVEPNKKPAKKEIKAETKKQTKAETKKQVKAEIKKTVKEGKKVAPHEPKKEIKVESKKEITIDTNKEKISIREKKVKKEKKIGKGTWISLPILGAITIAIFVLAEYIYGETSIFNQSISSNQILNTIYQKIPSVLKTIQIITIAWAITLFVRLILTKLWTKTARGKTVVKLMNSFIKYLVAIIAIMMILNTWGVDTTTLLASAGILSLIIGLGAQSLISDIIAGIFIVFEGEYEVDDIVIIDGWRGTVDEIGIRTTKIIDWQGNIKIVNNSAIQSIINQSKELSITTCVVGIDYRESIPKVELLIKNNIERIRNAIPEIVDGPYYKGVDSLGESSVNLLFIATVKETDFYVVQRALNREIKMIFDENNVCIPFPQVTINEPGKIDNKISAKQHKKANEFATEQRTVSKTMEDTNK